MTNFYQESLVMHGRLHGKMAITSKVPIQDKNDLSLAYTPGVAAPCEEIFRDPALAHSLTIKHNSVAVVTDGSAVLGLGNIGALASIPVMEGKAILFKRYADIDAWPICLDTQNTEEVIQTIRHIAPIFGGINLEDIAAPRCFEIENALQDLGIPVFHDDQHGTAIVAIAGLMNACKVTGKDPTTLRVVINGAGAAGVAIAKMLCKVGYEETSAPAVKELIVCDSKGIISAERSDLTPIKRELLSFTNPNGCHGTLRDVLPGSDVFIGVSQGNILDREDIRKMAKDPIILAMANPIPEILPEEARAGGAAVIGTGRSDFPNQVNNVLAFPGIFRGALNSQAPQITPRMKTRATKAIADCISNPTPDQIIPSPLDSSVAVAVADAVISATLVDFPDL